MIKPTSKLKAADLFCGAGGTTSGAEAAGVRVVLAVNHWRTAVQTHRENNPHVRHVCAEIDMVNPRDFTEMGIDILLASPECVFHSVARGGKPVDDQRRASAWCVPRWAESLRPRWLVIENVREYEDWGPLGPDNRPDKSRKGEIFQAWIGSLRALGYYPEWRILNSADYGAATKRLRLFIIARLGGASIPWPEPTHTKEQWQPASSIIDWSKPCPSIFGRKRPLVDKTIRRIEVGLRKLCVPGANSFVVKLRNNATVSPVDEPIGTVTAGASHHALATPFQFKAMGRNLGQAKSIEEPLPTVVASRENHSIVVPFISHYHNGIDGENRNSSIGDPLPVIDTNPRHAIVQPYLIDVNHGDSSKSGDRSASIAEPLGTVTGKIGQAVVQPFMLPRQGFYDCRKDKPAKSADEPLPTVTANHSPAHVVMPFLTRIAGPGSQRIDQSVDSMNEPLRTILTREDRAIVIPFLTEYYGTADATSINEPLLTVTTKHRHGLASVLLIPGTSIWKDYFAYLRREYGKSEAMLSLLATMEELGVYDIGFRMLDVEELAAAQGFASDYQIFGSKAEQIKQIGNSVHTLVAKAICQSIVAAEAGAV